MLGYAKKRTVVMLKTSTTSRSNQSDAKQGILVKQKLSTPPVNMLEEGKKVNEVYQKPLSPQGSVLKDENEVTMVEQKPFSPPGCIEGGIDKVTMVEQKSSASLVSTLGEGENITVVEQKLSAPPGSMLGQGNKLNVVNRRPSPKFREGKIVDLQQETSSPRRLTFRWGRHVGERQDINIRKRIFKKKGVDGDKSNTIPIYGIIVLRHQDVQEKKDVQGLLNNVIDETTSKLVETRKSKVKSLVGAFETVISLHNKPSAVTFS
ncbi:hypothetical protein CQW23_04754 [Capsicum baccatum]|uniref:Calmodulin-binding domain-containing protein n=1 Tax=Capsicum baccatum TaxID=33114 RepID=A0A2G2XFJ7_CAPBA|nr:hypothetical protein CQW23_04754 [Capsicum baccatum]